MIDSLPSDSEGLEVIVVDNASKGNDADVIEQRYPWVKVIRSNDNLGFAGGNNLGIKSARGKYLYFINNDTVFRDDSSIGLLVKRLESSAKIGAVCPKIRFSWGTMPIQYVGYTPLTAVSLRNRSIGYNEEDKGQYTAAAPTPYAHGAAMMVKREAIDKAGLMPECYFLYYEELDWSMMIRRAGYEIWVEPSTTIYHKESQSTGQQSPLRTYYIARNRLKYVSRNVATPLRYVSYAYLILLVGMKDIVKHTLHRRPDLAKATIRGVHDFIRNK